MSRWTLDDIPWDRFDSSKVDADLLAVAKAASLVERNGGDYATYLCNVFADDAEFRELALRWAAEEEQHGMALGRWAQPEEYAYTVCFLASEESSFITGQCLSPNGGMSIVGF